MKLVVLLGGLLSFAQAEPVVYIPMSSAVDYARMIARNEGYDVSNATLYTFDNLDSSKVKPFKHGYTAIAFDVDGHPRNLLLINNSTGQAIDFNSCEVFDYLDLKAFQDGIVRITKAKRKTPRELADEVGCTSPKS